MNGKPTFIVEAKDLGRTDGLRYKVITLIREESYDEAVEELQAFLVKDSPFPKFRARVERYIEHCADLVRAIEMKRSFPGINRLTAARQQDLKLKVKQHVDELIYCLKRVESAEISLRIEDVRSTIIVLHSLVLSVFALAIFAFVMDLSQGLLMTGVVVFDDLFQEMSTWIFGLLS